MKDKQKMFSYSTLYAVFLIVYILYNNHTVHTCYINLHSTLVRQSKMEHSTCDTVIEKF